MSGRQMFKVKALVELVRQDERWVPATGKLQLIPRAEDVFCYTFKPDGSSFVDRGYESDFPSLVGIRNFLMLN